MLIYHLIMIKFATLRKTSTKKQPQSAAPLKKAKKSKSKHGTKNQRKNCDVAAEEEAVRERNAKLEEKKMPDVNLFFVDKGGNGIIL